MPFRAIRCVGCGAYWSAYDNDRDMKLLQRGIYSACEHRHMEFVQADFCMHRHKNERCDRCSVGNNNRRIRADFVQELPKNNP